MKSFVTTLALVAVLGIPAVAMAQNYQPFPAVAAPPVSLSTCPQAGNMDQMHVNVSSMVDDLDSMIRNASDRSTRNRLQLLRDQMDDVASDMDRISPTMCGTAPAAPPQ